MSLRKFPPHRSSLGMNANVVVLFVWFGSAIVSVIDPIRGLAFLVPFIIFFIEKDSELVKEHAIQSITVEIIGLLIPLAIWLVPLLGFFTWILSIALFIIAIIACIDGWDYEEYEVPFVQPLAKKIREFLGGNK